MTDVNNDDKRPPISCYGCEKQGFIKTKCPNCSSAKKVPPAKFDYLTLQSCSVHEPVTSLLNIKGNGMAGIACADTGATHTIAGEKLFNLLRDQGSFFEKTNLMVTLVDGLQKDTEVHKAKVIIEIKDRVKSTVVFALPYAKGNRTLLGMNFLRDMEIVLDIPNQRWYLHNDPRHKFSFVEDPFKIAPALSAKDTKTSSPILTGN